MSLPIYSWHDWQIPGVVPMQWCALASDPVAEADKVIARATSEGACPPIMLWRLQDRGLLNVTLSDFVRGVYRHELTAAWVSTLIGRIAGVGLRPPMLVLDYEEGFSNWHPGTTVESFDKMLADGLEKALPYYARGITSNDLFTWPWDREAIIQWNRFAAAQRNDALRKAVVTPARAAYGQPAVGGFEIPISNYGDARISTPVRDYNDWEVRYDETVAGWSSPSCYLGLDGQRYIGRDANQGRYEDAVAIVKSCRATSWRVAPWISFPGYNGDISKDVSDVAETLWPKLVEDLAPMSSALLWWNPREAVPDADFERQRAIAEQTFAALEGN